MKKYIVALDQGTTSSRAIVFDKDQNIVSIAQKEITQIYPKAGYVEHDPLELFSSQYEVFIEALSKAKANPDEIAGIGIANQRETTIVWDKNTGRPIYNAIVWQCRRTSDICEELKKRGIGKYVSDNMGLVIDAYFSGPKIKWILDNVKGAREKAQKGELLFGTVDTWLLWNLTKGQVHKTDYTNASRTMLYNIRDLKWDENIAGELGIPLSMLPGVCNSSEIYGFTEVSGVRIPVAGIAGDQQAALFGQICFEKGDVKNTYGTGCFLLMNTGEDLHISKNGLISTIAVGMDGKVQYALEGSVFVGGAVMQWLRDELKLIDDVRESSYLANKVEDNGGVYIVPAFTGLGAPYWDMYARGCIIGITRGTRREHIIRAALESIAYQSADLVNAMVSDTKIELNELKVDGGASRNDFLMQFQADIINCPVKRSFVHETTALGAAYLAGLSTGFWGSIDEIKKSFKIDKTYLPGMNQNTRENLLAKWKKAVERSREWENGR